MNRVAEFSEFSAPLAFEDRFLVLTVPESGSLAPHSDVADLFGRALHDVLQLWKDVIVVIDIRGLNDIYYDVEDYVRGILHAAEPTRFILLHTDHQRNHFALSRFGRSINYTISGPKISVGYCAYDLSMMAGYARNNDDSVATHLFEFVERLLGGPLYDAQRNLDIDEGDIDDVWHMLAEHQTVSGAPHLERDDLASGFKHLLSLVRGEKRSTFTIPGHLAVLWHLMSSLLAIHRHSLMTEFVIQCEPDSLRLVPYHANALYSIAHPTADAVLVGRPGIFASRTASVFSDKIRHFEELINKKTVREAEIQRFLEQNPAFLRGLNYRSVRPQVVLERDDGTSLRPDFILEPCEGDWCDILELKRPVSEIIVGKRDRRALGSALHGVAAQLREYAAYFEESRYRRWVNEKYGLKLYRPRLFALIGREPPNRLAEAVRRSMTCYTDIQVLTFDQLLRIAKARILI